MNKLSKVIKRTQAMQPAVRKGDFINPHLKTMRITTVNEPGKLFSILKVLNKYNLNISNIESDYLQNKSDKVYFNLCYHPTQSEIDFAKIEKKINKLDCNIKYLDPQKVPDFPISLDELDNIGKIFQANQGLNEDMLIYKDEEYRKRRKEIEGYNQNYKMSDPIPMVDYKDSEHKMWQFLFAKLREKIYQHGCTEFVENFKMIEKENIFKPDTIPQLQEINELLRAKTNWRLKPVSGLLSQREYLNCLAFRTFCSTQYLRHEKEPFYTPEPDIFHEFLGHIPMFLDPVFCDISQTLGILSLGASDRMVRLIGNVYWFTVEFGVCKKGDEVKFYGGGIASSLAEIENMVKCKEFKQLNLDQEYPTEDPRVNDKQLFFYYIEKFKDFQEQLGHIHRNNTKPFKFSLNSDSTRIYIDRALETFPEEHQFNYLQ